MKLSRLLRRPKAMIRSWAYPVQRRLPIALVREPVPRAIMVFDPSTKYGGWVDRVKGMISVYELARLTGRSYQVYAGPTFPLDELVEPATFDWRIARESLRWNPLETGFHVSRDRWTDSFAALRTSRRKTMFVETNLDYLPELHPELERPAIKALWGERYRELFKLTPDLEREVEALVDPTAIAVHARFTSLLGDFRDVSSRALEPTARDRLLRACVARVEELAETDTARRIIVFSDSVTFLRAVENAAGNIVTIPGQPTHLDHVSGVKDSLRKTLLDFNVMLRCERIVQLRLGGMYDSNFSRYASYVHNVPFIQST
ncbi:MAG: hypothetical protein M3619_07470 [Myxococcota bacterium]|nr:hypothetical protein [Myxococcota bacterium]